MALALAGMAGCKKQSTGAGSAPVYTTIDWSTAGAIQGTVHYAGAPPKPIEIDMNPGSGLHARSDDCTASSMS